jgi:hypothetical protein
LFGNLAWEKFCGILTGVSLIERYGEGDLRMNDTTATTVGRIRKVRMRRRQAGWIADAESYPRPTGYSKGPDDFRLKAALKRAVLSERAPQTLIEAIKKNIRQNDESR